MGPTLGHAVVCRDECSFRNPSTVHIAQVYAGRAMELDTQLFKGMYRV